MTADSLDSLRSDQAPNEGFAEVSPLSFLRTRRPATRWHRVCSEFLQCHRRPLNVALHAITTPLGLFGFVALLHWLSPAVALAVLGGYVVYLALTVPTTVVAACTVVLAALYAAAHFSSPGWITSLVCLVTGYVGQDIAHLLTGERTLQSTYIRDRNWLSRAIEHSLFLLPTLLVVAGRRKQSPLRVLVSRKAVLKTTLTSPNQLEDLGRIRTWVRENQPNLAQSTHWWQSDLSGEAGDAYQRISQDSQLQAMLRRFHGAGYAVRAVLGMNELYVTGPPKQSTSDTVFYMGHVDGPWSIFPGARLYRCMVAASANAAVTTHFPMTGTDYQQPEGYRLETGDAVAFDFNRELHYITRDAQAPQPEPRINLKLHFVAYPANIPWYGTLLAKLTTLYDIRARKLFLRTIDPSSLVARFKTKWVLGWTKIFECMVRYVGWANLAYVLAMALIAMLTGDLRWFVAATSFVHYGIYIGTLAERRSIAFGEFRRNAVFFKTLALMQLFTLYAMSFSGQWLSLGLVVGGFSLATYATLVLGINRTLFGAELGFASSAPVRRFPYGVLPHPMILGAMSGIAAMLLVDDFRAAYGWLGAVHLCGYTAVLAQEIFASRCSAAAAAASGKV